VQLDYVGFVGGGGEAWGGKGREGELDLDSLQAKPRVPHPIRLTPSGVNVPMSETAPIFRAPRPS
jgi:hypothetical protein